MISAQEVKKLRERTGASMIQCKNALEESQGDIEKAIVIMQKSGSKIADKKCGRNTSEGYIGSYIHSNGKVGVLVEIACETDFVAKNEEFRELAHDLAMHVAANNPKYIDYKEINLEEIDGKKKELEEDVKKENKPANIAEKIVEGKVKKYFDEICFVNQMFVKNPDITVEQLLTQKIAKLGENINISKFTRFEIG
ncbi:MAG: translation elongation factor Ts [Candidatus Pacebacteria bacterium]|nr:translation elongation factor Ts [Candidatus Paceibacterota bacterium]